MIKKNLRHLHAVVTKQTYWRLMHWAEAVGLPEKEIGRIIDRLVREKALRESTSRRFEEKRQDAWRFWLQEKPAESGEYIVQIKYGKYATTLLYEKDTDEWWDHDPEYGIYKIVKWKPLPEV